MSVPMNLSDLNAPPSGAAQEQIARIQRIALGLGVLGLGGCLLGWMSSPEQLFRAYLLAYVFVIGIALGSLAIMMVHHLSGGGWGMVIRRVLESATRTLPVLAILFLPIVFGLSELYPWAREAEVTADELLQHKQPYLNVPFFLARAVAYFVIWIGVATILNRWSLEQDRGMGPVSPRRFRLLSAPGLLLYGLTVTFAAVDWLMSLTPHWFSTIFGILVIGGQGLSALAFVITVLFFLSGHEPLSRVVTRTHFHDLGKFLLAFVMLWAYFSFSQFLIIWSANSPEEIPWYLTRLQGGWALLALAIALGHFVLPFLLLLSRDLKRRSGLLVKVAIFLLAMRLVDLFWTISPAFPSTGVLALVFDGMAVLGIGGVWLWYFFRQLGGRALLPFNDPYLQEALEHGSAH